MKKISLSIVILLNTVFMLSAQSKSNFVMQLAGFDQYENAAVTIQRIDEDADVLKLETELTDGHVFSVIGGKVRSSLQICRSILYLQSICINRALEMSLLTIGMFLRRIV